MKRHLLKADVRTYESSKLIRRNLSQSLESRYLRVGSKFLYRLQTLLVTVAISGDIVLLLLSSFGELLVFGSDYLLVLYLYSLVSDAEKRGLEYIDVPFLDEFREELQEESDGEQAYVHAIHVGIRGYDNLVIAKSIESIFDVESRLKEVELFIFIHHLLGKSVGVERFTTKREDSLCVYIAAFGDTSAGRVTLGDENARLFLTVILHVGVVNAAVAQLSVVEVRLLGAFPCQLCDARHGFSFLLALRDFLDYNLSNVRMTVEIIIHFELDEVAYILIDADAIRRHIERTELDFGLRLEHRFFHIDRNGSHETASDVGIFKVLA